MEVSGNFTTKNEFEFALEKHIARKKHQIFKSLTKMKF